MARLALVPPALTLGPFRAADALAAGLLTVHQLRGSAWHRLFHGVYAERTLPVDHRMLCQAAGLMLPPGGAIGLQSAAHLWGVRGLDPGAAVVVLVPWPLTLRTQPNLVVRRAQLPASDITTLFGVQVTTAVRTAFDLARFLPRVDAVVALDAMLRQAKVSSTALTSYIDGHSWWPGVVAARSALSLSDGLAESPMETRMRLVIVDSGLPVPTAQVKIFPGSGSSPASTGLTRSGSWRWNTTAITTASARRFGSTCNGSGSSATSGGGCCGSTPMMFSAFRTEWSRRSERPYADLERWARNRGYRPRNNHNFAPIKRSPDGRLTGDLGRDMI